MMQLQMNCENKESFWRMELAFCFWARQRESAPRRRQTRPASFGPSNPFYAASTLPFQAPPFDKIKDSDYQPAIDAGMAQQTQRS